MNLGDCMRKVAMILGAVCLVVLLRCPSYADDTVWYWFATCGGPAMKIELRLDAALLFDATFPLCRANRGSIASQGAEGRMDFVFRAPRTITWARDHQKSVANDLIEADFWLAGSDPDALILGVSFTDPKRILLNSLHPAFPERRSESEMSEGLVVITYPAAEKGKTREVPKK